MFIGHYALGTAARGWLHGPPRTAGRGPSLGTWFLAVQWMDLVWPPLVLLGIERVRIDPGNTAFTPLDFTHYPWSHSLLMSLVWGVLFAAVYRWRTGDGRGAAWLGAGVFSHWVLDWITHRPDLPLYPGSDVYLGLGLWNSVAGTLVVEGGLFVLAVVFYARTIRAVDRTGALAWWSLVAFLVLVYAGNVFGPPPPSVSAIGVAGLALWLFVAWGYWIDRHRVAE